MHLFGKATMGAFDFPCNRRSLWYFTFLSVFISTWKCGLSISDQDRFSFNILTPENHSLTLASATQISLKFPVETAEFDSEVCIELLSTYFDKKNLGCFPSLETQQLTLGSLPYGRHQLRVYMKTKDREIAAISRRVFFIAVPMLPKAVAPSKSLSCPGKDSRQRKSEENVCRDSSEDPGFALTVLVNRGGESFERALDSWHRSGLLSIASELFIFLQEWPSYLNDSVAYEDRLVKDSRLRQVHNLQGNRFTIIGSHSQIGIGPALARLVRAVTSSYIMFVEEDFMVHREYQEQHDVKNEVRRALDLIVSERAHVVKLRHRAEPGLPFYPYVWKGNEEVILHTATPYISNHSVLETIHWLIDPILKFGSNIMWNCFTHSRDYFCAYSTHSGWSNNPFLTKKDFLIENIIPVVESDWTLRIEGAINLSPHLWDEKCFIIAQGNGIFKHKDSDGRKLSDQSPFESPFEEKVRRREHMIYHT